MTDAAVNSPRMASVDELARNQRVSASTIRYQARTGLLRSYRCGGQLRFYLEEAREDLRKPPSEEIRSERRERYEKGRSAAEQAAREDLRHRADRERKAIRVAAQASATRDTEKVTGGGA